VDIATSSMALVAASASLSSTIAVTSPAELRTIRPYPLGSGTRVVSTVARSAPPSSGEVAEVKSGVSPAITSS
jgi:hypothetical protein